MTVFFNPINNVFDSVSMIALHSFLLSYFLFPFSTIIEARLEHPKKTRFCITVTELGIVIEARLEQP